MTPQEIQQLGTQLGSSPGAAPVGGDPYLQKFEQQSSSEPSPLQKFGTGVADKGIEALRGLVGGVAETSLDFGKGLNVLAEKGLRKMGATNLADITAKERESSSVKTVEKGLEKIKEGQGTTGKVSQMVGGVAPYFMGGAVPTATQGLLKYGAGQLGKKVLDSTAMNVATRVPGEVAFGALQGYIGSAGENAPIIGDITPTDAGAAGGATAGTISGLLSNKTGIKTINQLIGTGLKDFSYGKNPGKIVDEGFVSSTVSDFLSQIKERTTQVGERIAANLQNLPKLSPSQQAQLKETLKFKSLGNYIKELEKTAPVTDTVLAQLKGLKESLTTGFFSKIKTPEELFNLKQVVANLTKFTGNQSDDKVYNQALQGTYREIATQIEKFANSQSKAKGKRMSELNDRYGNLITAQKLAEKASTKADFLETGARVASGGAAGGVLGGFVGSQTDLGVYPGIALGSLGGAITGGVSNSTLVRTAVARAFGEKPGTIASVIRSRFGNTPKLDAEFSKDELAYLTKTFGKKNVDSSYLPPNQRDALDSYRLLTRKERIDKYKGEEAKLAE